MNRMKLPRTSQKLDPWVYYRCIRRNPDWPYLQYHVNFQFFGEMSRLLDICYDANLTEKCPLEEMDECVVETRIVRILRSGIVAWSKMSTGKRWRPVWVHGGSSGFPCVPLIVELFNSSHYLPPLWHIPTLQYVPYASIHLAVLGDYVEEKLGG